VKHEWIYTANKLNSLESVLICLYGLHKKKSFTIYLILSFFYFDIVFAASFWWCLRATWPNDLIFLLVIRSITHNNAFVFNYFEMYACVCMSFIRTQNYPDAKTLNASVFFILHLKIGMWTTKNACAYLSKCTKIVPFYLCPVPKCVFSVFNFRINFKT
jgi:hypothetical protein